jgi:hypothetical protein
MKYFCGTEGCFNVAVRGTGKRARCEEHFDEDEPPVLEDEDA